MAAPACSLAPSGPLVAGGVAVGLAPRAVDSAGDANALGVADGLAPREGDAVGVSIADGLAPSVKNAVDEADAMAPPATLGVEAVGGSLTMELPLTVEEGVADAVPVPEPVPVPVPLPLGV